MGCHLWVNVWTKGGTHECPWGIGAVPKGRSVPHARTPINVGLQESSFIMACWEGIGPSAGRGPTRVGETSGALHRWPGAATGAVALGGWCACFKFTPWPVCPRVVDRVEVVVTHRTAYGVPIMPQPTTQSLIQRRWRQAA